LGIRSDADSSWIPGSVGSFSWSGLWGTYFWVDPAEPLIGIQLIHVATDYGRFVHSFSNLTYGALRVPDQGIPPSAPVTVDSARLAAYGGTYRFRSTSSRDRKEFPEFGGLGMEVKMENGGVKVVSPTPEAPAARAGVMANDIISHLDGEAMQGKSLGEVLDKMRGPVNTPVRLSIVRKGKDGPIELTVVRAQILLPGADLQVAIKNGKLQIEASGATPVLDFEKGAPITVVPMSSNEFFVDAGDHTRLAFVGDAAGKTTSLTLNPGPWQIMGQRIN
jgi:hypothetical protein